MKEELRNAHGFSSNHKDELLKDNICGCFNCLKVFSPADIQAWITDVKGTAICPHCGIDSVIGESSGCPIDVAFLKEMRAVWFG